MPSGSSLPSAARGAPSAPEQREHARYDEPRSDAEESCNGEAENLEEGAQTSARGLGSWNGWIGLVFGACSLTALPPWTRAICYAVTLLQGCLALI